MGPGVVVGEMDQARDAFAGERVAARRVPRGDRIARSPRHARSWPSSGWAPSTCTRAADTLSPGERTRAVLARFAAQGVNCLVLDEPTNHLDLPAIEQLEQALDSYDGTLLVVSHDRRLLETVELTRAVSPAGAEIDLG